MQGFSEPAKNLDQLPVRDGQTVADFGAGSGHHALELARRVGHSGRVYAIDVQKELVGRLATHAKESGLHNIHIIWGDLDKPGGSKLADGICDAVVISNILFQSEHKENLAREAARILKPGGHILVVDWSGSFGHMGPHPNQVVAKEKALEIFKHAGFVSLSEFSAGAHHWGVVLRKN